MTLEAEKTPFLNRPWVTDLLKQTTVSFLAQLVLIMVAAGTSGGMSGSLAGPLFGFVVAPIFVNALAVLIGLPLRFAWSGSWWRRHSILVLPGFLISDVLLVIAYVPLGDHHTSVYGEQGLQAFDPNWPIFLAGWFLLVLTITHTWLPLQWKPAISSAPGPVSVAE